MPAKGQAAQAEKARKKREKRAAKEGTRALGEDRDFMGALGELLHDFGVNLRGLMREVLSSRMRKVKEENVHLGEVAEQARKVAESRRSELDGQVERARSAEKEIQSLEGTIRDMKVAQADKLHRLQEIIEEQGSTIKAQARALRDAEKKAKV